jgi:DNA-binding transcriptional regulator YbjK
MPPPRNLARRQALTDAAIEILGTAGIHELSHRTVDRRAGVPAGTASNYFRSRDELLAAAAHRVLQVHAQDMYDAEGAPADGAAPDAAVVADAADEPDRERLARIIGMSLYRAATRRRIRYLAVYELTLEATRRPALAQAMAQIGAAGAQAALGRHRALGLQTTPEQARALMTLVGGALLSLVTVPAEALTPDCALELARCIVAGVLAALPAPHAEVGAAAAGTGQ